MTGKLVVLKYIPIGSKNKAIFKIIKESYAKRFYANIEEIPDYKIKTPLQRIVQLLKRSCQKLCLKDDYWNKNRLPLLITTLVAKIYPEV